MTPSGYRYNSLHWKEVLYGYTQGIFPMGNGEKSISWYEASPRAVIELSEPLKISRSLKQVIKKNIFTIKTDTAFEEVIRRCASRSNTWINKLIIDAYNDLFELGLAHSVEAWKDEKLAGGLYGVAFRGAFFGESMFYSESNASKVCVVKLYEILKKNNFRLLDIQTMTPHFMKFGAVNITKEKYHQKLKKALAVECRFEP
ncbi:MAG: leucyl/phenylalanyl-tRNA--protein transferase [Ignavibacteria bacterium]|nr:leucyl/phenylalanyl-tRNA--protein transferase [Ignavibacteria bacterium]